MFLLDLAALGIIFPFQNAWNNMTIDLFILEFIMSVKKIAGYQILMNETLGTGAYGTVYKGVKVNQDKTQCAIKIIDRRKIGSDPYMKSALLSQIKIMSKIKSPNVVGFFDVLESKHNYYIIQQICDSDLEKLLQERKKITEAEAIAYMKQICNGFLSLIRQGIVHRDLKPANILLSKGTLKICDFGFAKQNIHKQVRNQSSVGTPFYMSLELLKGKSYTSKCDIWAIGCIFYQMLHGKTPWTATTEYELVSKIEKSKIHVDQDLSQNTKDFIKQTLQTWEADRICWDDLFRHPIFGDHFSKYHNENIGYENKYKKVMGDLRFKINSENIDLTRLWEYLGFQEKKEIGFHQFQNFLQAIDHNMSKAQSTYFFQKMDKNGDGSISLSQFSSELQKYQIGLTSRYQPLQQKNDNVLLIEDDEKQQKWGAEFEIKVHKCFKKLYKIIMSKNLTLFKTFNAYDLDKSGELEIEQFTQIMKNLDPSFTMEEIKSIFTLIDSDESNTVQFDELNNYFCKVNGIPVNRHLPKQYRENKEKNKAVKENAKP